jgi:hypothetical protein
MKASSALSAGESRTCPHCRATILKSAVACPLCRHVLRFGSAAASAAANPTTCPLLVEGTIDHAGAGEAREYFILMEVRDESGKLLSRQSLGVGALQRTEKRVFSLRVEMASADSG